MPPDRPAWSDDAMWHRRMEWIDPVEAATRLSGLPSLSFLDSAMAHDTLGRYSYIGADPFGVFRVAGGQPFWNDDPLGQPPLSALRGLLAKYHTPRHEGLPPFQGGAIGAISYEFGWAIEGRIPPAKLIADDIRLAFYDVIAAFDHLDRTCWLMASGLPERTPEARRRRADARLAVFEQYLSRQGPAAPTRIESVDWRSSMSRSAYCAKVERVKTLIRDGDIYQANIAQRFDARLSSDAVPWQIYRCLRATNPAPFAAYLDCGSRQILSTSPELFLRCDGKNVETRPIKGTIRRSSDLVMDSVAARNLATSRKDQAENVMIVDLLRNDLAKVCEPLSVQVPLLCSVESYAGLHHLVSTVTGVLGPSADVVDLVAATFPGGSITGAPKLRAMEIIAEIEDQSRGIYCGAIGAFGFDGSLILNITIRTLVVEHRSIELRVGGGITILSDPGQEYEETLTKARRMFEAFKQSPALAEACA